VIPREGVESAEGQNLTCYQILDLYVIPREGVERHFGGIQAVAFISPVIPREGVES